MFLLRYDMRAPAWGPASTSDLYAAALDQAAWAEEHGFDAIVVSEHHGSDDGYLPSPLTLAAAIAGRTRRIPINVAALLVPLYDPVRLAEDLAVLDHVSGGRVSVIAGLGYRRAEYEMHGVDFDRRGERMETCLSVLRRAWTGEPFEHEGRTVRVTPVPCTPGGPALMYGGHSKAAARRAARFGLGFFGSGGDAAALEAAYHDECARAGVDPVMVFVPPGDQPTSVLVADDPQRAWEEAGPHLLHDARSYAAWLGDDPAVSKEVATTVEELRESCARGGPYRVLSVDEAIELARATGGLSMQPLCGGTPPAVAWESLRLVAERVIPAVREEERR